jgi:hypothetical protein
MHGLLKLMATFTFGMAQPGLTSVRLLDLKVLQVRLVPKEQLVRIQLLQDQLVLRVSKDQLELQVQQVQLAM